eukprot:3280554-Pyramimonas_sp.AAC.1
MKPLVRNRRSPCRTRGLTSSPATRTNQMRGEGIYLQGGPIRGGERVYTDYRADQSDEERGYIYIPTGRQFQFI